MKRVILSLALLLTVSMSALAQQKDTFEYNGLQYHITSDKTVEVYKCLRVNDSQIIPEKVTHDSAGKEYTVTGIYSLAFKSINITNVSIPATVKYIGDHAFFDCTNLTSLTFEGESQLEQIGQDAFQSTGLTTIDIPASVTSIDSYAFEKNTALRQVYMHCANPSGYDKSAFYDCPNLTIYAPSAASYEAYKSKFPDNKVEVELTEWKTYAENKIEEGLNALNTLSDEDRKYVNECLSNITTAVTFDAAYAAFTNAMPIINAQINLEKKLTDAIGIFATRKPGPAVEIRANDGTTIKLYNIEKVRYTKETNK